MSLAENLAIWHQHEPDRCYPALGGYLVRDGEAGSLIRPDLELSTRFAWLQRCVQIAIAAKRDWEMEIKLGRHPADGKPSWAAWVWRPEPDCCDDPFIGQAGEPEFCLLDAYVQALQANPLEREEDRSND